MKHEEYVGFFKSGSFLFLAAVSYYVMLFRLFSFASEFSSCKLLSIISNQFDYLLFIFCFLSKCFKGLTVWDIFFPLPLSKRFQRTNHLRYLLFPLRKIQGTNRLRILCLNTLKRTSFVVQVERTSTWVVIRRTRESTSLVDQFKWNVHPLGCSKRPREGTSRVDLFL